MKRSESYQSLGPHWGRLKYWGFLALSHSPIYKPYWFYKAVHHRILNIWFYFSKILYGRTSMYKKEYIILTYQRWWRYRTIRLPYSTMWRFAGVRAPHMFVLRLVLWHQPTSTRDSTAPAAKKSWKDIFKVFLKRFPNY